MDTICLRKVWKTLLCPVIISLLPQIFTLKQMQKYSWQAFVASPESSTSSRVLHQPRMLHQPWNSPPAWSPPDLHILFTHPHDLVHQPHLLNSTYFHQRKNFLPFLMLINKLLDKDSVMSFRMSPKQGILIGVLN